MSAAARAWVGGGSIAAVAGISPLQTPLRAYLEMVGEGPELDEDDRKFFARRKRVEDFVMPILEEEHGLKICRRNERYTDRDFDYMRAEIDGETEDGRNLEVKSVHFRATAPWGRAEDGDAGVPEYVLAQTIWGIGIRRPEQMLALAVAQIAFDETRLYPINFDEEVFQLLRTRARFFWHEHVLKRVAPAPVTASDAYLAWPKSTWRRAQAPSEVMEALTRMAECKGKIDELYRTLDNDKLFVQKAMTDADLLVDAGGKKLVTWRSQQPQVVVDYEGYCTELELRLRGMSMFPDEVDKLRAQFTKTQPGARPFKNLVMQ